MTFAELEKDAISSAIWITASPIEWQWTQPQIENMARFCLEAEKRLSLWRWLTEVNCTVQENSHRASPRWSVLDVDNDVIGSGDTPLEAILDAKTDVEQNEEQVRLML